MDWDTDRLEIAQAIGAKVKEGASLRCRIGSYPITVDAGANPEGLACALRSTAPDRVCTSTNIYFTGEVPLPLNEMYYTGVTFKIGHAHARMHILAILSGEGTGAKHD